MLAFAAFTLVVAALFGLFAMVFVYNVEDRVFERSLALEAQWLRAQHAREGHWPAPRGAGMQRVDDTQALPDGLAAELAAEPDRREFAGLEGRHYHLLPLQPQGPWLLMEVSEQLLVRPIRQGLIGWLLLWGAGAVAVALLLAAALARHTARPLQRLAATLAGAQADALPTELPGRERADEVGQLARSVQALLQRTREFIAREQAFTRDASHELRTPLAVLRLGLDQRIAATPAGAARAELQGWRHQVLELAQTLDTLLQLAREGEQPRAPPGGTPVLPLLEAWVLARAEWLDGQALRLAQALTRHDRVALAEPVLRVVLASLLDNAFRHGRAGGTVQVALQGGTLCVRNPSAPPAGEPGLGLAIVGRLLHGQGARLVLRHEAGDTVACVDVAPGAGAGADGAAGRA